MEVLVKEIDLKNKKDRKAFINYSWELYKDDPLWVPQLRIAQEALLDSKHPFYQTAEVKAFLAYKGDLIVGRIMAIHNFSYNKHTNSTEGHFGYFEAIDDLAVFEKLIEAARKYLASKNLTKMIGPMTPGTNYECGLLVDDYNDHPLIMMTYNPPYYIENFEKIGFSKAMDLLAYNLNPRFQMPQIILDIAARAEQKQNITFRSVNMKNWKKELDIIFDIYNSAWQENWGFVPMTRLEFEHTAKDLKAIVDAELIQYAMVNGKEAGFLLCLPDLNQVFKTIPSGRLSPMAIYKLLTAKKRITRARVVMMGVKKEYRKMGLETLLYRNIQRSVQKNPLITDVELSWILESNLEMNKPLIRMSGGPYKRYRLIQRDI